MDQCLPDCHRAEKERTGYMGVDNNGVLPGLAGILPVDKPEGFTSFDVVAKLRGMSKTRKIGHAGTLDPMATGVLPLFLGPATRFIDLLPAQDKRYRATLQLGLVTDTQDTTGRVLEQNSIDVGRAAVEAALSRFLGAGKQTPPMVSAKRSGGARLYELARRGIEIEREARPVTFFAVGVLDCDEAAGRYVIDVHCSKGTYIRTLCHDVGQALGCGGAMASLRRVAACGFAESVCHTLDALRQAAGAGELPKLLLPVESAFAALPRVTLDERQSVLFRNGVRLDLTRVAGPRCHDGHAFAGRCAVFDDSGFFEGLADAETAAGCLRAVRVYSGGRVPPSQQLS